MKIPRAVALCSTFLIAAGYAMGIHAQQAPAFGEASGYYESIPPIQEDYDPWEGFNRAIYAFNDVIDTYAIRPVAQVYRDFMPDLADAAVTNFFLNLGETTNLVNNLLQLKPEDAVITAGRFMFNSTFGLGGLIDVATGFGLPRQDEDFGQTLGYWGVDTGPYLVLPLLGPSTVRDTGGLVVDVYTPGLWGQIETPELYYLAALRVIDVRASLIPAERALVNGDRYRAIRNAYLQRREYQVKDGHVMDPFSAGDLDYLEDF